MKNVLIVEDIAETRAWLVRIIEETFPACNLTQARDVRHAKLVIKTTQFDLALIDLGLPDGSGIDVVKALRASNGNALAVVATIMGDDASIISALSAGADGYLLKDSPEDLFAGQLRQLLQGNPALSPSVARLIMSHFRATAFTPQPNEDLTPREREVLSLVGRGLRNSEVASALGLTVHTIASYIKSIYAKLGISSRAEAALKATRLGLTSQ
jgi:DNA-binding NarL/FixJ family response regulator